ncbi:putative ABC transporter C family member 15 [Amborella trichopoda]|uniref:ABC transporter C family member 3 n=1 Tax=Amborella trichopoda TaxID=13333 RepID=W1PGN4_AMBTC|nr:putative ABC transporter C family member 15 [Amborella trichopoda]ERN06796.1 hypothetical protein AMTR_s00005p00188900 [Amborella trichopoda]|eukprot:XP_006845121.1 putative ABC transporter C family member 15 [Amborella trichopoda]
MGGFPLHQLSILASSIFLLWVLVLLLCLSLHRNSSRETPPSIKSGTRGSSKISMNSSKLRVICCSFMSILYTGLWSWKITKRDEKYSIWVEAEDLLQAVTWLSMATFASYVRNRGENGGKRKWVSFMLCSGFFFSSVFNGFSICWRVTVYMRKKSKFPGLSLYSEIIGFLFSALLLCNSVFEAHEEENTEEEECKRQLLSEDYQDEEGEETPSDFDRASTWARLSFTWLNPLFESGRRKTLQMKDTPAIPREDTAEEAYASLERCLRKHKSCNGSVERLGSLSKALVFSTWRPLALNAALAGLNTLSSYAGPFLITLFIQHLSESPSESFRGYALAFALFIAKTVESVSQRHWYFGAQRLGIQVKAALIAMIYRKALLGVQGSNVRKGATMMNQVSVDAERIGDFAWYIHNLWLLPVQVFLALCILYYNLGPAASLTALATTLAIMAANTPLATLQEKYQSGIMDARDQRIKDTKESLNAMKILKLHAWETKYQEKILQLRNIESGWLRRYLYACAVVAFLFWAAPAVVSLTTFGVCLLVGTPLTTGSVLSALATFRVLQDPIYNLPELISMAAQTKISLSRISVLLSGEEERSGTTLESSWCEGEEEVVVDIRDGDFWWGRPPPPRNGGGGGGPALKGISLKVKKGWKVGVCGGVGEGKSSLLRCILGEMFENKESVRVREGVRRGYVGQEAWIQKGSVEENILFGGEMERERYERVVRGCGLLSWGELGGGEWEWEWGAGERGANLSGGQKQRVQMARAVYADADLYLLDDPFSALDAHTAAHLFKECVLGLLAEKTVIYVTHQLDFLSYADLVLVMRDGKIVEVGRLEELVSKGDSGELNQLMLAHNLFIRDMAAPVDQNRPHHLPNQLLTDEVIEEREVAAAEGEESERGSVKWRVYKAFVTAAYGGALVPLILGSHVMFQCLQMGGNYWMAWCTRPDGDGVGATAPVARRMMVGYAVLSAGSCLCVLARALLLATAAVETAQRLFHRMLHSVFRAPLSFFHSTPSTCILSRASTDQSTVDTDIPYRVAGLAFALIQLLALVTLASFLSLSLFFIFLLVISLSAWYQVYYISTARELARNVGSRRAPILHHLSETISGVTTIRCFGQEHRFLTTNFRLIDNYSRLAFHNSAAMEWLCLRINFLFNMAFFCLLLVILRLPTNVIHTSLSGLVATYGLNLNVLQAWIIWNLCNVENKMISVERIFQFTKLPSEAPLMIEDSRLSPDWPKTGTVEIENLQVKYKPHLPLVLSGISCKFPGGKKIGIVGRTGSGKSTLIQALFRVVEPLEGRILIDGVDISSLGLHDLRSRLSIIPQDPTLFQGSVRINLDPLQQHSDPEIWAALKKCQLVDVIRRDQRLLDAPVGEDGNNWSLGQRQLVCLARALLKESQILVLDEATASVDSVTDRTIQKTIREETSKCTVITIAHRIPTIIDSDLVLVLHQGHIVEYDSPTSLLANASSAFYHLVMELLRR